MILSTWQALLILAVFFGVLYLISKLFELSGAPSGPTQLSDGAEPVQRHGPATASAGLLDDSHDSSITFEFNDLPSARRACDNHYYLFGLLMGDGRAIAKNFLQGMQGGRNYRYEVFANRMTGGYTVKLTLT